MLGRLIGNIVNKNKVGDLDSKGNKHGLWIERYDDGKVKSVGHYEHGAQHGEFLTYHKNGNLWFREYFVFGRPSGTKYMYREDGGIERSETFEISDENNIKSVIESFYETGNIKTKLNFLDGRKHGEWFRFHENGNVELTGHYEDGSEDGLWVFYAEDGTIIKNRFYVASWYQYHETIFATHDTPEQEKFYLRNQKVSKKIFDEYIHDEAAIEKASNDRWGI